MSNETMNYEKDSLKLKRAYQSKKITLKQYYVLMGELKGRHFGKTVIEKPDVIASALAFLGLPLLEEITKHGTLS